jgi:hypothetical protein
MIDPFNFSNNNGSLIRFDFISANRRLCINCNSQHEDGSTCQEYYNRMGNIEHQDGENLLDEMILAQCGMSPL